MKKLRRLILIAVLVVVAAGLAAPFLSADRFRPRIQAALEASLRRRVQIGEMHLNLFTGPGFTLDRVLIGDDPAAGIEPFANVESMRARLKLSSLLAGRLAFSSVHLEAPSINLVKMASGGWNIQPWLEHRPQGGGGARREVPDIQISGGRLNFKFGDTKSVFYISDADVDVYPNERGEIVIRFSGAPGRNDRASTAYGQISARGLLTNGPGGEDQLNMGLRLERTAISDAVQLLNGSDFGVHGFAIADAKVTGPLSKLDITGNLNINDVHRWDLMPSQAEGWTIPYHGTLNLDAHQLDMETVAPDTKAAPVSIRFHLADYLSAPKWAVAVLFREMPAASVVETARHMGAPFPPGVQVDGKLNGGLSYTSAQGLQGGMAVANALLKLPGGGSAECSDAHVTLANNELALAPVTVQLEHGQTAELEGRYALDSSHAVFRVATRDLSSEWMQSSVGQVIGAASIPVFTAIKQGSWKGWITFDRKPDRPETWSGEYQLQDASLDVPGLASPIHLDTASVKMNDGQVVIARIRGQAGKIDWEGDYRYDPVAGRPHRLRIQVEEAQLGDLEKLMLPTLRRDESFFSRAFRRESSPLPKWLAEREVDASIQIGSLLVGDTSLGRVQTHVLWDGPSIALTNLDCRLDRMRATGKVALDVSKPLPVYRLTGGVESLDYRSGELDIEGDLETRGVGADLLLNLRSQGTFAGRDITLNSDTVMQEIAGKYRIAPSAGIPRLSLSNVEVTSGPDTLTGQGSSLPDGRLVLDMISGRRPVKLTGTLLPMHLDTPAR